jgi:hypothetical protein
MTAQPQSRVNLERTRQEYERFRASAAGGRERSTITVRATARILEDVHLEGVVRGHRLESDEPPERGGTNRGPAPLSYFVIGAAF